MAGRLSNETLLQQLKHGVAEFEIVSSPVLSISSQKADNFRSLTPSLSDISPQFFARIGTPIGGGSAAMKKVESYSVQKVTGDGRCLFRALSTQSTQGNSTKMGAEMVVSNDGWDITIATGPNSIKSRSKEWLLTRESHSTRAKREKMQYYKTNLGEKLRVLVQLYHKSGTSVCGAIRLFRRYELRMAVKEVICDNDKERSRFEEALIAITVEESLKRYCQRIRHPDFWGGESELLVLSKLCCQPIVVYIPEHEHSRSGWGSGFIPIAEYGSEFQKGSRKMKPRKAVRLLYSGRNHYDLLV